MIREPAPRFWLDIAWRGDRAQVAVHGPLDRHGEAELAQRIREVIEVARPRSLLLDLADVACADRAPIRALAAVQAAMPAGGQITIVPPGIERGAERALPPARRLA
jgi:anti-anti-sigma regulatory factor